MSTTTEEKVLNFRRFKDGDAKGTALRDHIFQASYTYKCPTYIQSTPPCQGSCPEVHHHRGRDDDDEEIERTLLFLP